MKRINLVSPSKYDSIMSFVKKVKLTLFSNNQMVLSNAVVNMCLSTVIQSVRISVATATTSCGNGKLASPSCKSSCYVCMPSATLWSVLCNWILCFSVMIFDAARQIALDLQLKKSIWCANSDYNYFSFISVFVCCNGKVRRLSFNF
jgi:hypothetical protein